MELERLKFLSRVNQSSGRKIRELSECWFSINKPSKRDGYCNYQTDWAKENGVIYAHQAAYKLFKDENYKPSREHPCSHLCESKDDTLHRRCCNPEHLEIVNSIAENIAERDKVKGNYQSIKTGGTNNGFSKFTSEDVIKIKQLREEGKYYKDIALLYGVSRRTIEKLCLGKTYK